MQTWCDLIHTSYFINTQMNFIKNSNTPRLLLEDDLDEDKKKYALHHDNENIDFYAKFEFPFNAYHRDLTVLGIRNGLICLTDRHIWGMKVENIILWNPFIRKAIYLPKCKWYGKSIHKFGFGYDFPRNDYKVVRVTYDKFSKICKRVEIYRLSKTTWEDIIDHSTLVHSDVNDIRTAEYVNGCLHWIGCEHKKGYNYNDPNYNYMIVGFDMHTEMFRKIVLPPNLNRLGKKTLQLYSYHESLCLIHNVSNEDCKKFDIWFMTEYDVAESWTKQFTIDMTSNRWPQGLRNNGDILWGTSNYCIMSYHPHNKNIEDGGEKEGSERYVSQFSFYVGTFMLSLVLLDKRANNFGADNGSSKGRFPKWWD